MKLSVIVKLKQRKHLKGISNHDQSTRYHFTPKKKKNQLDILLACKYIESKF